MESPAGKTRVASCKARAVRHQFAATSFDIRENIRRGRYYGRGSVDPTGTLPSPQSQCTAKPFLARALASSPYFSTYSCGRKKAATVPFAPFPAANAEAQLLTVDVSANAPRISGGRDLSVKKGASSNILGENTAKASLPYPCRRFNLRLARHEAPVGLVSAATGLPRKFRRLPERVTSGFLISFACGRFESTSWTAAFAFNVDLAVRSKSAPAVFHSVLLQRCVTDIAHHRPFSWAKCATRSELLAAAVTFTCCYGQTASVNLKHLPRGHFGLWVLLGV